MLERAQNILKKYYGFSSFKPGQENIITSILSGRDTLGILPTGGGKSICYQIPALLFEGVTLVISPLISLMKDQVDALHSLGVSATFINSSLEQAEVAERFRQASRGTYKLFYVAPERLESDRFLSLIQSLPVSAVAIDEAHCISTWGHDFRPSYLAIAPLIQRLSPKPVVSAFTATATKEVTADIANHLAMHRSNIYVTGFNRENLTFSVVRGENKRDFISQYVKTNQDQSGIIYAATRKEVDHLHQFLRKQGLAAGKYHAGLTETERATNQEQFLYDDIRIMVATNAFGMGIDKSNVRYVIHHNMPKNMEAYYQEAGRAGRDGEPGECTLLFNAQDVQVQKFLIEQTQMSPERKMNEYKKLQTMTDYCHTSRCLRQYILTYFGEQAHGGCDNCGNCQDDREKVDITLEAQKIFSCIRRMKERYGTSLTAKVLRGSKSQKVLQLGFQKLSTYGLMRTFTEKDITDMIHLLVAEKYLALTEGQYPVLKLQRKAIDVLTGTARVWQKVRQKQQKIVVDNELFERLRALRREIARRDNVPPYIIFPDSTLREMSHFCPADEEAMLQVKGVGEKKLKKYGEPFLHLLQTYIREHGATPLGPTPPQKAPRHAGLSGTADSGRYSPPTSTPAPQRGHDGRLSKNKEPAGPLTATTSAEEKGTPSHLLTLHLFRQGKALRDIAAERGLAESTVEGHLIRCGEEGHDVNWEKVVPVPYEIAILEAAASRDDHKLKSVKEALPDDISYFQIQAVLMKHKQWRKG